MAVHDTSGIHQFQNDDRNQFADLWLNSDGKITIKVSNGRPWRPMWIVLHATFLSEEREPIAKRDYHVFCPSPRPGGHGEERWFNFPGNGLEGTASIGLSSNKEAPWGEDRGGWYIEIPIIHKEFWDHGQAEI